MGEGKDQVALVVDVANAERGIDRGLIGIGGGPVQVVEVETGEELGPIGDLVVEAQGELVRVGHHWGGTGVGVHSVGPAGLLGSG